MFSQERDLIAVKKDEYLFQKDQFIKKVLLTQQIQDSKGSLKGKGSNSCIRVCANIHGTQKACSRPYRITLHRILILKYLKADSQRQTINSRINLPFQSHLEQVKFMNKQFYRKFGHENYPSIFVLQFPLQLDFDNISSQEKDSYSKMRKLENKIIDQQIRGLIEQVQIIEMIQKGQSQYKKINQGQLIILNRKLISQSKEQLYLKKLLLVEIKILRHSLRIHKKQNLLKDKQIIELEQLSLMQNRKKVMVKIVFNYYSPLQNPTKNSHPEEHPAFNKIEPVIFIPKMGQLN